MLRISKKHQGIIKAIKVLASVLLLLLSVQSFAQEENSKERGKPNIILFLTDDQGWTDTSLQMMEERPESKSYYYQTPQLERLAQDGIIFSEGYSPAAICSPTRTSIQFGKTPARLRNTSHNKGAADCFDEIALPIMFKTADPEYMTAHFGKWGLHDKPERWGYDISSGHTNNYHGDWVARDDRRGISDDNPKRIFSMTKKANDFMEQQVKNGRPFYLQVSHYALHSQHRALKETIEKYRKLPPGRRCIPADYDSPSPGLNEWILEYAAMIENLDSSLGSILDKLEELDIADNTYIVFMSDNGGSFRGNDPLRGKKAQLWEGGIRVPFVIRGPGVKKGVYCSEPVTGWDLYKTFADIIGTDDKILPTDLDGCSIKLLFANPQANLPRGPEGLVFHFPYDICDSAIRLGDYKLILDWENAEKHLYNLKDDLSETKDMSEEMPDKTQELFVQLARYLKEVNAENPIELQQERVGVFEKLQQNIGQDLRRIMSSQDPDASDQWSHMNLRRGFINRTLKSSQESLEQLRENVLSLGVF